MAQRDLPLSHLDAKRLADIVGLAHGDLTAWREVALAEVGEQERRLSELEQNLDLLNTSLRLKRPQPPRWSAPNPAT